MEALLILPIAGLLLPARYALRLGALGLTTLLAIGIYDNTPLNPGAGQGLGLAMIFMFFVLFFGAITLGLVVRAIWGAWRSVALDPADLAVPALVDALLVGLAMVVPAGMFALALGNALSGNVHPLAVHLGLLATMAATSLASVFTLPGLARAAVLGLSLRLAVIVVDSMRLERQVLADVTRPLPDQPRCLAVGPQGLPPDHAVPLMGLTAPKPIILQIADPSGPQFLRWSFRWHGFVEGGISAADVRCIPALP